MKRRAKLRNFGILIVLMVLVVEGLSFLACKFLQGGPVIYRPAAGDFVQYMKIRDPELGWPPPGEIGTGEWDAIGSRLIPAFPDPFAQPAVVSLYGDSFTWSDAVDPAHAWSNVLAERIGGRVNNFGVKGYGSDQAYLRYARNADDRAPVVVLGHLSVNILRNLNQLRDLVGGGGGGMGFKPRFILDDAGELVLIPLPTLTEAEYLECVDRPESHLKYEEFTPGERSGAVRMRFPFTLTAVRALGHFALRAKLTGEPWYSSFYRADHPARGVAITAAILERFTRDARARGQQPVVLLLPTQPDLLRVRGGGDWTYSTLTDELSRRSVPFLDAGPLIVERLAGSDVPSIFTAGDAAGHFNEEGYSMLAEIVFEHLVENDLLP